MNETVAIHPAWQQVIRKAQDAETVKFQAVVDEEAEAERLKAQEQGERLQTVLEMFGIPVPRPLTENRFILDNIGFSLVNIGASWQPNVFEEKNGKFRFKLGVWYEMPQRYKEQHDPYVDGWANSQIGIDWQDVVPEAALAELAYCIDHVTETATAFMRKVDEKATRPEYLPAPTLEQQFLVLLRQLIRDELSSREEY